MNSVWIHPACLLYSTLYCIMCMCWVCVCVCVCMYWVVLACVCICIFMYVCVFVYIPWCISSLRSGFMCRVHAGGRCHACRAVFYPSGSSRPAPSSLPPTPHSHPSSTTSVSGFPPPHSAWPSRGADPRTLHTAASNPGPSAFPRPSHALTSFPQGLAQGQLSDGRFFPGPSPSSMVCPFPQFMPMSWSNPAPSNLYSASSALIPHPLGFYSNPHFGPYYPQEFFPGPQYYPQR